MKENLVFSKAEQENIDEICQLYQNVIKNTFTTWDKNYPSRQLLVDDIKNKNLYVLKLNNKIVAVSFLGKYENDDDWTFKLKTAFGIARICVSPDCQGQGIGAMLLKFLIEEAKKRGADGLHFHVCVQNISAIKMYEKAGFKNCGIGKMRYGFEYYKYEMVF